MKAIGDVMFDICRRFDGEFGVTESVLIDAEEWACLRRHLDQIPSYGEKLRDDLKKIQDREAIEGIRKENKKLKEENDMLNDKLFQYREVLDKLAGKKTCDDYREEVRDLLKEKTKVKQEEMANRAILAELTENIGKLQEENKALSEKCDMLQKHCDLLMELLKIKALM